MLYNASLVSSKRHKPIQQPGWSLSASWATDCDQKGKGNCCPDFNARIYSSHPASRRTRRFLSTLALKRRDFRLESKQRAASEHIQGKAEQDGKPMPVIDGLIAATALTHDLTVVTRNTRDMEPSCAKLLNPWEHTE